MASRLYRGAITALLRAYCGPIAGSTNLQVALYSREVLGLKELPQTLFLHAREELTAVATHLPASKSSKARAITKALLQLN